MTTAWVNKVGAAAVEHHSFKVNLGNEKVASIKGDRLCHNLTIFNHQFLAAKGVVGGRFAITCKRCDIGSMCTRGVRREDDVKSRLFCSCFGYCRRVTNERCTCRTVRE